MIQQLLITKILKQAIYKLTRTYNYTV